MAFLFCGWNAQIVAVESDTAEEAVQDFKDLGRSDIGQRWIVKDASRSCLSVGKVSEKGEFTPFSKERIESMMRVRSGL